MSIFPLLKAACVLAAGALPFATQAQINIEVGAKEEVAFSDGLTFGPGVTRAFGRAGAALGSGFVQFAEGIPGCVPGVECGPFATVPGGASAGARADATKMNVGVRGNGSSSFTTQGAAEISVKDALLVPAGPMATLIFDIHLDFELSATANADATYKFGITLGSGDERNTIFSFEARDDDGLRTAQIFRNNGSSTTTFLAIPSSYEELLTVPVLPGSIPIEVFSSAVTNAGSGAFAFVDAFNSAWLGIQGDYASANGYSYPGFAAAIPEPSLAALLLAGLGVVLLGRRRVDA